MNLKPEYDIAIIGGGAAGLMAAISGAKALNKPGGIIILERQPRVGKKLLATGNGRCNLSNLNARAEAYNGGGTAFIKGVLNALNPEKTLALFKSLGLLCRIEDDGRVYPRSNQANSVLDILRLELEAGGIECLCDFEVLSLEKRGGLWKICGKEREVLARRIIIAAGGGAGPQLGGNMGGFSLGQKLGHTLNGVYPGLTPVKILKPSTKSLRGLRARGAIELWADNLKIQREEGEIQFTEYGLSGICVFNLSRHIGEFLNSATVKGRPCRELLLKADLLPEYSFEDLLNILKELKKNRGALPAASLFTGFFPKRIGEFLLKEVYPGPLSDKISLLTPGHLASLAKSIKSWEFKPQGLMDWANAQISVGGISCREINKDTLESQKAGGVYFAGEILDIDGPCGGYNLQWAWSSGYLAGLKAAASLKGESQC